MCVYICIFSFRFRGRAEKNEEKRENRREEGSRGFWGGTRAAGKAEYIWQVERGA